MLSCGRDRCGWNHSDAWMLSAPHLNQFFQTTYTWVLSNLSFSTFTSVNQFVITYIFMAVYLRCLVAVHRTMITRIFNSCSCSLSHIKVVTKSVTLSADNKVLSHVECTREMCCVVTRWRVYWKRWTLIVSSSPCDAYYENASLQRFIQYPI